MDRKVLPLFLLFLFLPLSAQDVRLSMGIVGWSRDGHFAWEEKVGQTDGETSLLKVVDLVTDELVYSGDVGAGEKAAILESYSISTQEKGTSLRGNRLVHQGVLYEVELFSESDRVNIRLKNVSGGTYKEVNASPLGGDEMEIKGSVISPFEKRAALVFLRMGNGRAEYMVTGAHLTLGFKAVPLEQEPLIEAVLNGQYYISRLILEKTAEGGEGPDGVRDDRGYTPLLLAARTGHWEIAGLLLEYGARADIRDDKGLSPADYARKAGQTELAERMENSI